MTNEEKELLLKDLCARLPYGIFVKENSGPLYYGPVIYTHYYHPYIGDCKPYLRPMESMTKEEMKSMPNPFKVQPNGCISSFDVDFALETDICDVIEMTDWLNAHYFDYCGLIEKGLALEAHDGMYNNNMEE